MMSNLVIPVYHSLGCLVWGCVRIPMGNSNFAGCNPVQVRWHRSKYRCQMIPLRATMFPQTHDMVGPQLIPCSMERPCLWIKPMVGLWFLTDMFLFWPSDATQRFRHALSMKLPNTFMSSCRLANLRFIRFRAALWTFWVGRLGWRLFPNRLWRCRSLSTTPSWMCSSLRTTLARLVWVKLPAQDD